MGFWFCFGFLVVVFFLFQRDEYFTFQHWKREYQDHNSVYINSVFILAENFYFQRYNWPVYNKSLSIWIFKTEEYSKERLCWSSSRNWFYSDCGWFYRFWALGTSVCHQSLQLSKQSPSLSPRCTN